MKVENIRVCHSALSDRVYAGKLNKKGDQWLSKKDVTNDFINCVLNRWVGFEQTITAPDGTEYEIRVKKKEPDNDSKPTTLRRSNDPDEEK